MPLPYDRACAQITRGFAAAVLLFFGLDRSLTAQTYAPYQFTTLAGNAGYGAVDAQGSAARFYSPAAVAADANGNVYVADAKNEIIRKITPLGVVTTFAGTVGVRGGTDGTGTAAKFNDPQGIAVDGAGNVYVADSSNCIIREITPEGVVTTLAGTANFIGNTDATGSAARFNLPYGVVVDPSGTHLYVADSGNHSVRQIVIATGAVTTLAGVFSLPEGVAVDGGGDVFVSDAIDDTISKITAGGVTILAGTSGVAGATNGTGAGALFNGPSSLTLDAAGANLYVADAANDLIREVAISSGAVTTLAGMTQGPGATDATGLAAQFSFPSGVAISADGTGLYVADNGNNMIRQIVVSSRAVTTLAGAAGSAGSTDAVGAAARFNNPTNVALDAGGNVYVTDTFNDTIRVVYPSGAVATLGGVPGVSGDADGVSAAARFQAPRGVAVDAAGNVYVADTNNSTIRVGVAIPPAFSQQPGNPTVTAGSPLSLSVAASDLGAVISYQWQVSADGGVTWANLNDGSGVSGSSTANLSIGAAAGWLNGYEFRSIAMASGGSTTSAVATVTVDAASSPSTYFGSIGSGSQSSSISALSRSAGSAVASSIAAQINTAGTGGVLIGYISSLGAGFAVNFNLGPTGGFSATTSALTGGASPGQTLTFTGSVASGTISGTIVELSLPFSAALDASSGASAALSGFYQAAAIGSAGETYSIVGTQGEVFALTVTASGVGAGVGTVSGSGTIAVVTQNGATVAGTVNASSGTLVGTITPSGGGAITSFSGAAAAPTFTVNPQAQSVATGRSAAFNATAGGSPAYQWTVGGTPISGATDPILLVGNTASTSAGSYACVATNASGSTTSTAAALTVAPTSNPGHLINLSTRADVGTGNNLLIGGFVIGGTGTKQLLVRGVGPTLTAPLGGSGELATPQLTLLDVHGLVIASNIGWGNALTLGPSAGSDSPQSATGTLMDGLGAATYTAGSADTAMVVTAPAGNSTAEVVGVGGTGGIALVEFYDADTTPTPTAHLINISARADVGTGNNILIGGFAVSGATSETVLIRAVGPGLVDSDPVDFSLATVLNQPVLTLLNSSGVAIYSNTVWGGDATLATVFPLVGAFTLNPAHADSVLLVTLPAGTYTAEVSGLNGGTGIALCEIYEVH